MDTPTIETTVIDDITAQRLADIFEALSDKTRLKIISALAHQELVVGELARLTGGEAPFVIDEAGHGAHASHHHAFAEFTRRVVAAAR